MLNSINLKNNKTKIVLVGNIAEMNTLSSNYVFYQKNFINLSGKTSFDEFIYLHFLAKTILSNDSVSGHLAHYFKKNSYTFLGGGHFKRFFPYPNVSNKKHKYIYKKMKCFNCNWNCIYDNLSLKNYPCIDAIYKKKNLINI
jgi:ADP-heptose:LPS heptosyltransferase